MSSNKSLEVEYIAAVRFIIPPSIDLASKDVRWEIRHNDDTTKYLYIEQRTGLVGFDTAIFKIQQDDTVEYDDAEKRVVYQEHKNGKLLWDMNEDALGFPTEVSRPFGKRDAIYRRAYDLYLQNIKEGRPDGHNFAIVNLPYWDSYKEKFDAEAVEIEKYGLTAVRDAEFLKYLESLHESANEWADEVAKAR